jgi:hypothetical protein
MKGAIARHNKA